ncbi:hypothetical protein CLOP_g13503 [Closterium sp. NIES-67]|nr:hypothetical protein CLOP_g13503 [Closterium sp. NIES-67]
MFAWLKRLAKAAKTEVQRAVQSVKQQGAAQLQKLGQKGGKGMVVRSGGRNKSNTKQAGEKKKGKDKNQKNRKG